VAAKGSGLIDFVWALQILAAAQFFVTGLDKLGDAPPMIQLFQTVGFGQWLRYFTGTLEVVSAVLLLMPSRAALGAAFLVLTMIAALVAHATVLPFSPAKAVILLVMVTIVFWVRRRELTV
jgi:putative oxidoreductase